MFKFLAFNFDVLNHHSNYPQFGFPSVSFECLLIFLLQLIGKHGTFSSTFLTLYIFFSFSFTLFHFIFLSQFMFIQYAMLLLFFDMFVVYGVIAALIQIQTDRYFQCLSIDYIVWNLFSSRNKLNNPTNTHLPFHKVHTHTQSYNVHTAIHTGHVNAIRMCLYYAHLTE